MNQDEVVKSPTDRSILTEIEQANLNVLLLAQSLLKADKNEGMLRFGMDEPTANFLTNLSIRHIQLLARSPHFLFPIKLDHKTIGEILGKTDNHARSMAHLIISGNGHRSKGA